MKFSIAMVALAAAGFSQINTGAAGQPKSTPTVAKTSAAPAPVVAAAGAARPGRQLLASIEKQFDAKLEGQDINDPFDVVGPTRGIYLDGYGTVFTMEASLIRTPNINAFKPVISEAEKKSVWERKVKHLPLLKSAMKETIISMAGALNSTPANDQIVLNVRLLYYPWENTSGLPMQIRLQGDRKSLAAGNVQATEE
jgi:hypothetical protein